MTDATILEATIKSWIDKNGWHFSLSDKNEPNRIYRWDGDAGLEISNEVLALFDALTKKYGNGFKEL